MKKLIFNLFIYLGVVLLLLDIYFMFASGSHPWFTTRLFIAFLFGGICTAFVGFCIETEMIRPMSRYQAEQKRKLQTNSYTVTILSGVMTILALAAL